MSVDGKSSNSRSHKSTPAITIGYYNLRGKAQVCRLLCEFLQVQYEDKLFSLKEWSKFKNQKTKKWVFSDLPFLQQGQFTVTDPLPMCLYVIARFGNSDLLGKTLEDKATVDMYLWTIEIMSSIIGINCQKMSPEEVKIFKEKQWRQAVSGRLQKYQSFAHQTEWFLGYLTIVDFSIYELVRYMEMLFPGKLKQFPKMSKIKEMIGQLPQIKAYQQSPRCIREMDPSSLLAELNKSNAEEATNKAQSPIKANNVDESQAGQKARQQVSPKAQQ